MSNYKDDKHRRQLFSLRLKPVDVAYLAIVDANRTRAVEKCVEGHRDATRLRQIVAKMQG